MLGKIAIDSQTSDAEGTLKKRKGGNAVFESFWQKHVVNGGAIYRNCSQSHMRKET